ncbi:MAG: LysE family transporter [Bacteroidota bacterium]
MIQLLGLLFFGFSVSFVGSIPPGSLNVTSIQIGLKRDYSSLFKFAFAAGFVEFFYALFAVKFQHYVLSSVTITQSFHLITGLSLLIIGLANILPTKTKNNKKIKGNPFLKGALISVFNPMAIPFWVMTTAYFETNNWLALTSNTLLVVYCIGISAGTIALLYVAGRLAGQYQLDPKKHYLVEKIPGSILILLGLYNFVF